MSSEAIDSTLRKKRRSGIPTGNAGEYFVMGELLRRGYDAQIADRNTKGYDVLIGRPDDKMLRKAQVKTARAPPWYVNQALFRDDRLIDQVTIYVLIGNEEAKTPIRYFIARNRELAAEMRVPSKWQQYAFMPLKSVERYEGRWDLLVSS